MIDTAARMRYVYIRKYAEQRPPDEFIARSGYYSRAALIFLRKRYVRLLFEGGYYSMCGYYSNKYGIINFCFFPLVMSFSLQKGWIQTLYYTRRWIFCFRKLGLYWCLAGNDGTGLFRNTIIITHRLIWLSRMCAYMLNMWALWMLHFNVSHWDYFNGIVYCELA